MEEELDRISTHGPHHDATDRGEFLGRAVGVIEQRPPCVLDAVLAPGQMVLRPLCHDGAYADNTYATSELRQLQRRLVKLVEELPERESKIIRRHHFQQVPFDEIALSLGLTKGRISQIHRRALTMLKDALRGRGALDLAL